MWLQDTQTNWINTTYISYIWFRYNVDKTIAELRIHLADNENSLDYHDADAEAMLELLERFFQKQRTECLHAKHISIG